MCVALAGPDGLSEETLREAILTLETKVQLRVLVPEVSGYVILGTCINEILPDVDDMWRCKNFEVVVVYCVNAEVVAAPVGSDAELAPSG